MNNNFGEGFEEPEEIKKLREQNEELKNYKPKKEVSEYSQPIKKVGGNKKFIYLGVFLILALCVGSLYLVYDGKFQSSVVNNCADIPSCPVAPSCPICPSMDCGNVSLSCDFPSTIKIVGNLS